MKPGLVTHGVITAVKEYGCLVTFYNNVRGLVPAQRLKGTPDELRESLTVGKALKCRIVDADVDAKRLTVTFNLDDDDVEVRRLCPPVISHFLATFPFI